MTTVERLEGNVGGAWLIDGTVHRTTGRWTPAVHALLGYLRPRLPHIPEVLGYDTDGREVLSYLPGRVIDSERDGLNEAQLRAVAEWTRNFHDAVAGFDHPGPWRLFGVAEPTLIGHNDIAPYNICFDGDTLVGVFDWDLSGPSTPLFELAFLAWNGVPLWRDIGAEESAARLAIIVSGYGQLNPREVLRAVPSRIQLMLDAIPAAAADGDEGMVNLMRLGEPQRSQAALDALRPRIPEIDAVLTGTG